MRVVCFPGCASAATMYVCSTLPPCDAPCISGMHTCIHIYSGTSIKEHHKITSLQRTLYKVPRVDFPIVLMHFPPLKSGQPLHSGQIG